MTSSLRLGGALTLLVGALMLCFGGLHLVTQLRMAAQRLRAVGEVVRIREEEAPRGAGEVTTRRYRYPTVRFETARGAVIEAERGYASLGSPPVGARVAVYYDPDDPGSDAMVGHPVRFAHVLLAVVGTMFVVCGTVFVSISRGLARQASQVPAMPDAEPRAELPPEPPRATPRPSAPVGEPTREQGKTVRLAWEQEAPGELVADRSAVYFVAKGRAGRFAIKRCAVTGCGASPEIVAEASSPNGLAQDRRNLYWATFEPDGTKDVDAGRTRVMAVPKTGGAPRMLLEGRGRVGGLAATGAFVFVAWRAYPAADIQRIAVEGGEPTLVATGQCFATPLAVTATDVFWGSQCNHRDGGGVWTVRITGGEPRRLAFGASYFPVAMVASPEALHWVNTGPGYGGDCVTSLALPDGKPQTVVTREHDHASFLAADDDEIFWVSSGENGLAAADRASGATRSVAKDARGVGIAVDGDSVYWTDADAGTVMKAPKR